MTMGMTRSLISMIVSSRGAHGVKNVFDAVVSEPEASSPLVLSTTFRTNNPSP
jgi:hypothetical protein